MARIIENPELVKDYGLTIKFLCPIGHLEKATRHRHEGTGDMFRHEETVGKQGFARVYLTFQRNEYPQSGVEVTAAITAGVLAMGTVMPPSYYKKSGTKPNNDPKRAGLIGKRLSALLIESRMVRKLKAG